MHFFNFACLISILQINETDSKKSNNYQFLQSLSKESKSIFKRVVKRNIDVMGQQGQEFNRRVQESFTKYGELGLQRYLKFMKYCIFDIQNSDDYQLVIEKLNSRKRFSFVLSDVDPSTIKAQKSIRKVDGKEATMDNKLNQKFRDSIEEQNGPINDNIENSSFIVGEIFLNRLIYRCQSGDCSPNDFIYIVEDNENTKFRLHSNEKDSRIGYLQDIKLIDIMGYVQVKDLFDFIDSERKPKYQLPFNPFYNEYSKFNNSIITNEEERMDQCVKIIKDKNLLLKTNKKRIQTMSIDLYNKFVIDLLRFKAAFSKFNLCSSK